MGPRFAWQKQWGTRARKKHGERRNEGLAQVGYESGFACRFHSFGGAPCRLSLVFLLFLNPYFEIAKDTLKFPNPFPVMQFLIVPRVRSWSAQRAPSVRLPLPSPRSLQCSLNGKYAGKSVFCGC